MRKALLRQFLFITFLSVLMALLGGLALPARANVFGLDCEAYKTDYQFRVAGLTKDRSQIPAMLQYLKGLTTEKYGTARTIFLSLSQIGDPSVVPDLDAFIQHHDISQQELEAHHWVMPIPSRDLAGCAKAARARLLAESTGGSAQEKVDRFLKEAGLTPATLNAAIQKDKKWRAGTPDQWQEFPETVFEGYALRQLADMIWHGNYWEYAQVPAVQQIDFSPDRRAALKINLAQMPPEAGRQYLAMLLSGSDHSGLGGSADSVCQQLLIEMGRQEAAPAIVFELNEMDAHRAQYKYNSLAYEGLFDLLVATGYADQDAVFARYFTDSDEQVRNSALGHGPHRRLILAKTPGSVPDIASFDPGD